MRVYSPFFSGTKRSSNRTAGVVVSWRKKTPDGKLIPRSAPFSLGIPDCPTLWVLRQKEVVKSLYSYSKALGERWSLRQTLYPYSGGVYNDKQSLVLPEMGWITIGTIGGLLIRLAIWSIFVTPKGDLQDLTIIRFVLWVTWILWSLGSSPWPTQVHKAQNAAHGGGTRVGPCWDGRNPRDGVHPRCKSCYGAFPKSGPISCKIHHILAYFSIETHDDLGISQSHFMKPTCIIICVSGWCSADDEGTNVYLFVCMFAHV
jgi:hypothetical protein